MQCNQFSLFGVKAMLTVYLLLVCIMAGATANFWEIRESILKSEKITASGGKLILNEKELLVNKVLIEIKKNEIAAGVANSSNFLPRLHFFESKSLIEKSKVFKFIQDVPKGGSLHTHLTAAVSFEKLFDKIITSENLYANYINETFKLRYINDTDPILSEGWTSVSELRENKTYDDYLKSKLSLEVNNPKEVYPTIEVVWQKFMDMFSATYDMYSFRPFFEDVLYIALEELLSDNVIYAEFRAAPLLLYELNGIKYTYSQFCKSMISTISKFKESHPKFLDARLILSPSRRLNDETMEEAITVFKMLKSEYPDFVVGFDLIGFEELGRPLVDLYPLLEPLRKETKFYFHAGETNWYGTETDLNLLDAVLLGSSRIGHAFSLIKHPEILNLIKNNNTAIEITPISNQVLMLVEDFRNHPGVTLLAQGLPIVVCNDDPSFWGTSGLSYDWYMAFMGMSNKEAGLEFLKQLALNSLVYSALNDPDKILALQSWEKVWNEFISDFILKNDVLCSLNK